MNTLRRCALAALLGLAPLLPGAVASAATPATVPASERVHVTYAEPQNFSESRSYGYQDRYNGVHYLEPLRACLVKRAAPMLAAGQRLDVTVTDIQLAGGYEPWQGQPWSHVRIMSNRYPPRIDLTFRWIGSDGKVLREGSRKLFNLGYLDSGSAMIGSSDPLRYDKALIDRWLRRGLQHL